MSQHTQGQLHTGGNGTIIYDKQGWGVASATVYHARQEPETSEANARRLAACWNACEGVSTERLESDFAQGYEPRGHVQHLQAQRDQLLAALERMVEYHVPKVNPLSDAAELSGRAAIAATKGGAA